MLSNYATTWTTDDNGNGRVTYHQTTIVEWTPETITLRTGGHHTVTTKKKMNQAAAQFGLGFHMRMYHGTWLVDDGSGEVPFHDGIVLRRTSN
jgi:hypothetical protein